MIGITRTGACFTNCPDKGPDIAGNAPQKVQIVAEYAPPKVHLTGRTWCLVLQKVRLADFTGLQRRRFSDCTSVQREETWK